MTPRRVAFVNVDGTVREHADRGDLLVVSGSVGACLAPLGRYVRADAMLGSTPRAVSGVYAGEVHPVLAGEELGKAPG